MLLVQNESVGDDDSYTNVCIPFVDNVIPIVDDGSCTNADVESWQLDGIARSLLQ